jgi:hypothetical protein
MIKDLKSGCTLLIQMDPPPVLKDYLVSILVALARHSPQSADAILNCTKLVQNVVKLLDKQGSTEIHSSEIKVVTLLKVSLLLRQSHILG